MTPRFGRLGDHEFGVGQQQPLDRADLTDAPRSPRRLPLGVSQPASAYCWKRYGSSRAESSAKTPKWSDSLRSPFMLLITPKYSATRSSVRTMWSMLLRPRYPSAEVAMDIPSGMALPSAMRKSKGV